MTAIIYCHKTKQVAVDSMVTAGGVIKAHDFDKTIKSKDGSLWIISGDLAEYESYANLEHGDKVNKDFYCAAIVIRKGKAYSAITNENNALSILELKFNEYCGSGGFEALCALDFDKTAKEAVEYAATKDCHTGGKVRVFNLDGVEVSNSTIDDEGNLIKWN